jgi:Na+/serine symporter
MSKTVAEFIVLLVDLFCRAELVKIGRQALFGALGGLAAVMALAAFFVGGVGLLVAGLFLAIAPHVGAAGAAAISGGSLLLVMLIVWLIVRQQVSA